MFVVKWTLSRVFLVQEATEKMIDMRALRESAMMFLSFQLQ